MAFLGIFFGDFIKKTEKTEKNRKPVFKEKNRFYFFGQKTGFNRTDFNRLQTLLKADSKSDNLKLLEKALYSIPPTSVLSEREFSKSTHFLNPGRSLMTDEHLNDLCFLKDLFETTIKKTH